MRPTEGEEQTVETYRADVSLETKWSWKTTTSKPSHGAQAIDVGAVGKGRGVRHDTEARWDGAQTLPEFRGEAQNISTLLVFRCTHKKGGFDPKAGRVHRRGNP